MSAAYRIVTDRLVLRCWEPRDAPLLKAAIDASFAHLGEMPWIDAEPQTLEQKVALLRRFRGEFDLDEDYVYGVFDRAESRGLGGAGLHHIGRGLATEAAGALTRAGFELTSPPLDRIEIHCGPANPRSARVAQKLGYTRHRHDVPHARRCDHRQRVVDERGVPEVAGGRVGVAASAPVERPHPTARAQPLRQRREEAAVHAPAGQAEQRLVVARAQVVVGDGEAVDEGARHRQRRSRKLRTDGMPSRSVTSRPESSVARCTTSASGKARR